jgi:hypothetical protein
MVSVNYKTPLNLSISRGFSFLLQGKLVLVDDPVVDATPYAVQHSVIATGQGCGHRACALGVAEWRIGGIHGSLIAEVCESELLAVRHLPEPFDAWIHAVRFFLLNNPHQFLATLLNEDAVLNELVDAFQHKPDTFELRSPPALVHRVNAYEAVGKLVQKPVVKLLEPVGAQWNQRDQ